MTKTKKPPPIAPRHRPRSPPAHRSPPASLVAGNGPKGRPHRVSWRVPRRDPNQSYEKNSTRTTRIEINNSDEHGYTTAPTTGPPSHLNNQRQNHPATPHPKDCHLHAHIDTIPSSSDLLSSSHASNLEDALRPRQTHGARVAMAAACLCPYGPRWAFS